MLLQIFASMISSADGSSTSKWSGCPCSRSRSSAVLNGKHDGKDGDVVDDLDDREEPAAFQIGIKQRPHVVSSAGALLAVSTLAAVGQQLALENPRV